MTTADIKANLNKTVSRQYPLGEPTVITSDEAVKEVAKPAPFLPTLTLTTEEDEFVQE